MNDVAIRSREILVCAIAWAENENIEIIFSSAIFRDQTRRSYNTWFHLEEKSITGIETESRLVVAGSWG